MSGVRWSRLYLMEDDDALALVDTGPPWSARNLFRYIESIGRKPDELRAILMTHGHPDHSGSAYAIIERSGAELFAHAGDTRPGSGDGASQSHTDLDPRLRPPLPFFRPPPVSRHVEDGQLLPILGGIRVLDTPGHTPGSVCYLLEGQSLIFSGDTVFSDGKRVSRSVPFPGYDRARYTVSLQKLAALEFDALCGGHGSPLLGGASDKLRDLLAARPDPPTWRDFFKGAPRRILQSRGLGGEF